MIDPQRIETGTARSVGDSAADISEESVVTFVETARRLEDSIQSIVIGQHDVVRQTIIALLAGGHALLEGVPGLGKTLLVRTLADVMDLTFSRIQFTPDLMPADITGTTILQEDEHGRRTMLFQSGPVFSHLVLADEVNRATPKTQSALLEAMQERTVTVGNDTHQLPAPFFVMATQNPLEMEGTYPLPEAQLDRFLLKILVPFPNASVLRGIVEQTLEPPAPTAHVVDGHRLAEMVLVARAVPIAAPVLDYAIALVVATHPDQASLVSDWSTRAERTLSQGSGGPETALSTGAGGLDTVRQFVRAGASPRGLQALVIGAQVRALLEDRYNVSVGDLQTLAHPALRHRLLINFEGQAEGITTDAVIDHILQHVPEP